MGCHNTSHNHMCCYNLTQAEETSHTLPMCRKMSMSTHVPIQQLSTSIQALVPSTYQLQYNGHALLPYLGVGTCCPLIIIFVPGLLIQLGPQSFGTPIVEANLEFVVKLKLAFVLQAQVAAQCPKIVQHLFALVGTKKGIEEGMSMVALLSILLAHPPGNSEDRIKPG